MAHDAATQKASVSVDGHETPDMDDVRACVAPAYSRLLSLAMQEPTARAPRQPKVVQTDSDRLADLRRSRR
jgi:hypothetical protein